MSDLYSLARVAALLFMLMVPASSGALSATPLGPAPALRTETLSAHSIAWRSKTADPSTTSRPVLWRSTPQQLALRLSAFLMVLVSGIFALRTRLRQALRPASATPFVEVTPTPAPEATPPPAPASALSLEQDPAPAPAVQPVPSPEAASAPFRLLLAEDNLVNQKVAVRILERFGYEPDVVGTGLAAVEALQQQAAQGQPYHAVLLDVHMPVMSGIDALSRLREVLPKAQQPWVIMLTANALPGSRESYLEAGADDYLSKPFNMDRLQEKLMHARTQSVAD